MRLKPEHGALEIKGLGIRLDQMSSQAEIESALKAAPHLAQFIDGIEKPKTEKKDVKTTK